MANTVRIRRPERVIGSICVVLAFLSLIVVRTRDMRGQDSAALFAVLFFPGVLLLVTAGIRTLLAQRRWLARADAALARGDLPEACNHYKAVLTVGFDFRPGREARFRRAVAGLASAYKSAGVEANLAAVSEIVADLERTCSPRFRRRAGQSRQGAIHAAMKARFAEAVEQLPGIEGCPNPASPSPS